MEMFASGIRSQSWSIWRKISRCEDYGRPMPLPARHARAIAAEMHAGFAPLRRHLPMNMRRPVLRRELDDPVSANVRRIEAIWTIVAALQVRACSCIGGFGAADAMYAPVVSRFYTYDIGISQVAAPTCRPLWRCRPGRSGNQPRARTVDLPEDEVDWPIVHRL